MLREQLDTAMVELQAAMSAAALYDTSHDITRARIAAAHAALNGIFQQRGEVTVACLGDHVICDDMRLPSSDALSTGLFHRIASIGFECLNISRGVTSDELRNLVVHLNTPDAAHAGGPVWRSTHVRLGAVDEARSEASHTGSLAAGQHQPPGAAPVETGRLQHLWNGVARQRSCEPDTLEGIVGGICETVSRGSDTLLPLATLKRFDEYTFTHTINVALLSAALAEAAGLSSDLVADITAAALLHDIGKQAIPTDILNKKGGLTDEERDVMKRHPIEGAVILFDTPGVPSAAPIVAYEHHMHHDGSGYPAQPPGWQLSQASQLVQVADIFDALRTHRPYRDALPLEKAREIMDDMPLDKDLAALFFERVARRTDRELEAELGLEDAA